MVAAPPARAPACLLSKPMGAASSSSPPAPRACGWSRWATADTGSTLAPAQARRALHEGPQTSDDPSVRRGALRHVPPRPAPQPFGEAPAAPLGRCAEEPLEVL